MKRIEQAFDAAAERYAESGVNVDKAIARLLSIPISIQCWQGDDVVGFEVDDHSIGGGLAVTGNYPGRARDAKELRSDLERVLSLVPGRHRLNLHASYGDFGGQRVDRDEIALKHYEQWIDWARGLGIGLDFNPTCFAHKWAESGFTLAHADRGIRDFWIEHCRRSRRIGAAMGQALGGACITNLWIPDGYKDTPADRAGARSRLLEALDAVFAEPLDSAFNLDAVESKLFGIGAESCTVGSHEFYLGYAVKNQKWLCLDSGHFHPTESIADKISSCLLYLPGLLLHVSRGVRWDSDHVITFNDDLIQIAREGIRSAFPNRVRFGLDFFDASVNRLVAWVIGIRNLQRALLFALLEPPAILEAEIDGNDTRRLALQEEAKGLPFGAIWDGVCLKENVPDGPSWLTEIEAYERSILSQRDHG